MTRLFLSLISVHIASAAFTNCGSAWPVRFNVDPPAAVGSGQNVSMFAEFDVPVLITDGTIFLQAVAAPHLNIEIRRPLCQYLSCPITAGTYSWSWTDTFPEGFVGKVQIMLQLIPSLTSGPPQRPGVCLFWSAFATGTPSNETNSLIKWLYA